MVIHCRTGTFAAATVAAVWLARSQGHSPADALDASAAVDSFKFVIWGMPSGSVPTHSLIICGVFWRFNYSVIRIRHAPTLAVA